MVDIKVRNALLWSVLLDCCFVSDHNRRGVLLRDLVLVFRTRVPRVVLHVSSLRVLLQVDFVVDGAVCG